MYFFQKYYFSGMAFCHKNTQKAQLRGDRTENLIFMLPHIGIWLSSDTGVLRATLYYCWWVSVRSRISGVYDSLETHLLYRKFYGFFSISGFYKDVITAVG